ncbi:hypothetical protein STENM327S_08017 [Streptomyces tendae]
MAVPEHGGAGTDVPARQAVGPGPGRPWPPRPLRHRPARPARGPHRRAVPDPADHGTPPATPTTPGYRAAVTHLPCVAGSPSSSCPRTPNATGSWSARRSGWPRGAARCWPPSGSTRPCDRALAFMSFHFPDEVDTNQLTIEANCPIAGTAEFDPYGDPDREGEHRWTCASVTANPRTRNARPSTPCSVRPSPPGKAPPAATVAPPTSGGHAAAARPGTAATSSSPALHALNDRVGWISEGALDYVCRRLTVPPARGLRRGHLLRHVLRPPPPGDPSCTSARTSRARRRGRASCARPWRHGCARRAESRSSGLRAWACANRPRRLW